MKLIKNSIYKAVDILTLNKGIARQINGFKILFPAKWSRYFESDYESENVAFIKESCKPGMTVLDIGAHLGLMSVTISQLVGKNGRIYCFEPTPNTYKILTKIIELNGAENIVTPVNAAVAKEEGTMDFYLASDEGSNSNSLVSKNHRDRVPVKINVTTIDSFVQKHSLTQLDFLKIDAEGSEYEVLLGGLNSFTRFNPKIILALHPPLIENNNQNIEDIYNLLIKLNYRINFRNREMSKEEFCTTRDFFDVHLTKQ